MNLRNELRYWLRRQLKARGYGAQARLAEYLNLTPMQVTSMLNTTAGKKSRNIQAEELLQILRFFDIKIDDPFLSLEKSSEKRTPATSSPLPGNGNSDHAALIRLYDKASPKQREAIMKLVRALAETYNIPH